VTQLAEKLGQLGISEKNEVVVYDDDGGMFAGRAWWLLTYLGHPQVHLLEQGWQEWKARQLPTEQTVPTWPPSTFTLNLQPQMIASRDEVMQKMDSSSTSLMDARAKSRYLGEEEPLDPIAGHIPHAQNYFWKQVHGPENKWKEPQQLRQHFSALSSDQEVIVYCGSGISATPNILALQRAGFSHVKLYPGGWSDWISYPDAPVAKGQKPLGQKAKPAK
jgi:thiosulfate/3-mercaptopyruvate sulfurtransferase